MSPLNLLLLENTPIFKQLQIEEALLRTDRENWCLINQGSTPSIVMGISNQQEKLICSKTLKARPIPLIRRFSGGGSVAVNEQTLFVSFILNHSALPVAPFPEPILRWTAEFYQKAWSIEGFALRENDYVIFEKKCGGNAQYIKKERLVHHTTFLFDLTEEQMSYLLLPEKKPAYRENRSHLDFLTPLKNHYPSMPKLTESIKKELEKRFKIVNALKLSQVADRLDKPHRQSTVIL